MSTLITFLGRGPSGAGEYRKARYRFTDGSVRETAFFGLAAADVSAAETIRVLGTSGSMWDVLLIEHGNTAGHEAQWDELAAAVGADSVTQDQLDAVESLLNRDGARRFQLRLIPYGYDEREQIDILRGVTAGIDVTQSVYLDVTHALRHLPMLGLLAAFYLRAATGARLAGIYYGAFERTENGETPVLRLDGLLQIYDWIRALEQFNKDGDYSSFSDLFDREKLPGKLLREAAFLERIANASEGSRRLDSAMRLIETCTLSPAAALFAPLLEQRSAWRKGGDRAAREKALAQDYLERRDYLRATQFAFESRVSAAVFAGRGDPNVFDNRKAAEDELYKAEHARAEAPGNFRILKNLRNALAHGVMGPQHGDPASTFLKKLTSDEEQLRNWLARTLREIE